MKITHVIGRQRFNVGLPHRADAPEVFDRISDLMKNRLQELIGELLSELNPSEGTLVIDRLEIDVGRLTKNNLEEELTHKILEGLQREIVALPEASGEAPDQTRDTQGALLNSPSRNDRSIPGQSHQRLSAAPPESRPTEQGRQERPKPKGGLPDKQEVTSNSVAPPFEQKASQASKEPTPTTAGRKGQAESTNSRPSASTTTAKRDETPSDQGTTRATTPAQDEPVDEQHSGEGTNEEEKAIPSGKQNRGPKPPRDGRKPKSGQHSFWKSDQADGLTPQQQTEARPDRQRNDLKVLEYFLIEGRYPWWVPKQGTYAPTGLLLAVLEQDPDGLRELLSRLLVSGGVTERLRWQFSSSALMQVNDRYSVTGWSRWYADLLVLTELLEHEPPFGGKIIGNPISVLLVTSLQVSTGMTGMNFNSSGWLKTILADLASVYATPVEGLGLHLRRIFSAKTLEAPWPAQQVDRIVKLLDFEQAGTLPEITSETDPYRQVLAYLQNGVTPSTGPLGNQPALEQKILNWLAGKDERFLKSFREILRQPQASEEAFRNLSRTTLRAIDEVFQKTDLLQGLAYQKSRQRLTYSLRGERQQEGLKKVSTAEDWLTELPDKAQKHQTQDTVAQRSPLETEADTDERGTTDSESTAETDFPVETAATAEAGPTTAAEATTEEKTVAGPEPAAAVEAEKKALAETDFPVETAATAEAAPTTAAEATTEEKTVAGPEPAAAVEAEKKALAETDFPVETAATAEAAPTTAAEATTEEKTVAGPEPAAAVEAEKKALAETDFPVETAAKTEAAPTTAAEATTEEKTVAGPEPAAAVEAEKKALAETDFPVETAATAEAAPTTAAEATTEEKTVAGPEPAAAVEAEKKALAETDFPVETAATAEAAPTTAAEATTEEKTVAGPEPAAAVEAEKKALAETDFPVETAAKTEAAPTTAAEATTEEKTVAGPEPAVAVEAEKKALAETDFPVETAATAEAAPTTAAEATTEEKTVAGPEPAAAVEAEKKALAETDFPVETAATAEAVSIIEGKALTEAEITATGSEPGQGAAKETPLSLFQHFLEQGQLPASYAAGDLPVVMENIYRQVLAGRPEVFKVLARSLQKRKAYERFRRNLPVWLLYLLAYQLANDDLVDLRRGEDPERQLGFSPPTHPALRPPLHLRPRPEKENSAAATEKGIPFPDQTAAPHPSLTPRQLLFAALEKINPGAAWWPAEAETFLRYSYAFIVQWRVTEQEIKTALEELIPAWITELAGSIRRPQENVAAGIVANLRSTGQPPGSLERELQKLVTLQQAEHPSPTDTSERASPSKNRIPPDELTAEQWSAYLTNAAEASELPAAEFEVFLSENATPRNFLASLLNGKKILPQRFRKLITAPRMKRLVACLKDDLPQVMKEYLRELPPLLQQQKIYLSPRETDLRLEDYLLLLLWGQVAIPPQDSARLLESLLALIAREAGSSTRELAAKLLLGTAPSGGLREALRRISAQLEPEERDKIKNQIREESERAKKRPPGRRRTQFLLAVLAEQLRTGTSPWWGEKPLAQRELFLLALAKDSATTLHWLKGNKGLADQIFPLLLAEDFTTLAVQTQPDLADFMLAFTEGLIRLRSDGTLSASGNPTAIWQPIWQQLTGRSSFNSEAFVRKAIRLLGGSSAASQRRITEALSLDFTARIDLNDVRYYRLAAILEDLRSAVGKEQSADIFDEAASGEAENSGSLGANAGAREVIEQGVADSTTEGVLPGSETLPSPKNYTEELTIDLAFLRHFFHYGTPPSGQQSQTKQQLLRLQQRIIQLHPDIAANLYRAVCSDRIARERLIRFFPESLLREILHLLLSRQLSRADNLHADLEALLPQLPVTFQPQAFRQQALTGLLAFAPLTKPSPTLEEYPEYLLTEVAKHTGTTLVQLFNNLRSTLAQNNRPLREDWDLLLDDIQTRKNESSASENLEDETTNPPTIEEKLFIHNAGLVILGAFLPRYFGMLGMLNADKQFEDLETAKRALLLLEYLASGRTEVPEHELAFNKVLCGLPVTEPVPAAIELTDQEIDVSGQMLNAILHNWDKMSDSTVENLRGSFLLRDGTLEEHEDHWAMTVERKGYDILLSFLPWTISLLSPSWMNKRIETNWKTTA